MEYVERSTDVSNAGIASRITSVSICSAGGNALTCRADGGYGLPELAIRVCVIPRETWTAATVLLGPDKSVHQRQALPHVSTSRAFAETGYLGAARVTPARVCLLAQFREQNRRRFDARKGQN
jgi:hypothetical protein